MLPQDPHANHFGIYPKADEPRCERCNRVVDSSDSIHYINSDGWEELYCTDDCMYDQAEIFWNDIMDDVSGREDKNNVHEKIQFIRRFLDEL